MKDQHQKIVPHLWFDNEAKEAARFYVSAFGENSKVTNATTIANTPSGDVDVVTYSVMVSSPATVLIRFLTKKVR